MASAWLPSEGSSTGDASMDILPDEAGDMLFRFVLRGEKISDLSGMGSRWLITLGWW